MLTCYNNPINTHIIPLQKPIMISKCLLEKFEIQSVNDDEAGALLQTELPIVNEEQATSAWFAISFGRSDYVILDIFPDKEDREIN